VDAVRLFVLALYRKSTWKLVDTLGEAGLTKYWSDVTPDWIPDSDAENNEGVELLLKAARPRAAFYALDFSHKSSTRKRFTACFRQWRKVGMISPANISLSPITSKRHLST
jgi:hypothetical protein